MFGDANPTLSSAEDVFFDTLQEGQSIRYNSSTHKWNNAMLGGGGSSSFQVVTKNTNNTWPTRPAGVQYVMWIGVGAPDPPATTQYDVWLDTTP